MKKILAFAAALLIVFNFSNLYLYAEETDITEPEIVETTLDGAQLFVEKLYKDILGREADEEGLLKWTEQLRNQEKTASDTILGFFESSEYSSKNETDEEYIETIIKAMTDKKENEEIKTKLLSCLETGVSRSYLYAYMVNSAEFDALCTGYGIEKGNFTVTEDRDKNIQIDEWIQNIYLNTKGRKADTSELNSQAGELLSGHSAADVAYNILFSEDSIQGSLSDEDYIKLVFRSFTEIEATDEELSLWVKNISEGYTRTAVVRGVVRTDAFTQLCEKIGITRGDIIAGGWRKDEYGLKQYTNPDTGILSKGYVFINDIPCYFDNNGYLRTDWSDLTTVVNTTSALYTYNQMIKDVSLLQQQYPSLVSVSSIGKTADGRQIIDIAIGSKDASKQLVIQAGCHAREYMTCLLVMNQAEYFLKNYWSSKYDGREYKELLSDYQIHIIPMLNPDGISLSQFGLEGINSSSIRSKIKNIYKNECAAGTTTLGFDSYLKSWKANALGVDINRNFNVNRNQPDAPKRPSSSGYLGYYADSEYETQALTRLVKTLSNVQAVISYHSSGSMIYWAYGQTGVFRTQCSAMASGLKNTTTYYLLNSDDYGPGCSNWVAAMGIRAATIEIGYGNSPLPVSQYSSIWNENKNVIPYLLDSL